MTREKNHITFIEHVEMGRVLKRTETDLSELMKYIGMLKSRLEDAMLADYPCLSQEPWGEIEKVYYGNGDVSVETLLKFRHLGIETDDYETSERRYEFDSEGNLVPPGTLKR